MYLLFVFLLKAIWRYLAFLKQKPEVPVRTEFGAFIGSSTGGNVKRYTGTRLKPIKQT